MAAPNNHPNRPTKAGPRESRSPTPGEIAAWRAELRISTAEAGALVHSNDRAWRRWEDGTRAMHPAFWELVRIKAAIVYGLETPSEAPG